MCGECRKFVSVNADGVAFDHTYLSSARYRDISDPEECWQYFWAAICAPDGDADLDLIKAELCDYHTMLHEVALVYDHVTNSHISKPNTSATAVIGEFDAFVERLIAEAVEDVAVGEMDHPRADVLSRVAWAEWRAERSDKQADYWHAEYDRVLAEKESELRRVLEISSCDDDDEREWSAGEIDWAGSPGV